MCYSRRNLLVTVLLGASGIRDVLRVSYGMMCRRVLDASEGKFPVYTPATSEAFAVYGTLLDIQEVCGAVAL